MNNEKMQYARDMLMGRKPPRDDIPCLKCGIYKSLAEYDGYLTEDEVRQKYLPDTTESYHPQIQTAVTGCRTSAFPGKE
ncbi:MAG: hypothetical protein HQK56_02590 [Deltaproteobacteria bacterium]|nr:hypothetical protein [Deltaproteobacteria bacterium]